MSNSQDTLSETELESEAKKEPEGLPKVRLGIDLAPVNKELEGLPKLRSGIDLAPVDNLLSTTNGNFKDYKLFKGYPPVLRLDCRIKFASNWKLISS